MVVLMDSEDGSFSNFDISEKIIKRLKERNIERLFPVQYKTFNAIYSGKDAVVLARMLSTFVQILGTGTGKTLSFSLPIVQKLCNLEIDDIYPLVLVLAPTRELVVQITKDFQSIAGKNISCISLYGGVPYGPQCSALRTGVQIVVGAPGRIIDLMDKDVLKLHKIRYVVLDEVDRMLDMGFSKDVEKILTELYEKDVNPQTLLFSATMPSWISNIANKYLSDNTFRLSLINEKEVKTSTNVEVLFKFIIFKHLAILSPYEGRASILSDVIRVYCKTSSSRCIVFCERKKDADELASHDAMSSDCHVFHGDIPQDKRELVLQKFREGKYRTLLTTNVAARGLDVPSVDLVIQCHPPKDVDDYIHRSGRTGRADRTGISVCFYTMKERERLMFVEKKAGIVFRRISPPTVQDIANIWGQEIEESLKSIPQSTWSSFKPIAKSIALSFSKDLSNSFSDQDEHCDNGEVKSKKNLKSKAMLRALCCTLARLSGKDGQLDNRSALTAQKGMTAYKLDLQYEALRKGLAYAVLRRYLSSEIVDGIRSLSFIKGKSGFVFDLSSEHDELVRESWPDTERNKLSVLTEIPELEDEFFSDQSHAAGGGRSFGYNHRGRGGQQKTGWNRGRGRGMKRSFGHVDSSAQGEGSRPPKWFKSKS